MTGTIAGSGTYVAGSTGGPIAQPGTYCMRVTLSAPASNTADVLLGNSGAQNFHLPAGQTVTLDVVSPSLIYAAAASGTQTVTWIATT
jgi:hypothetical protein